MTVLTQTALTQTRLEQPYPTMPKTLLVRKTLQREIRCLKRQMERLQHHKDLAGDYAISTYQEMIVSRERMLDDL